MKFNARITLSVALLPLLATVTGCNFLKSRDQLNKGITAFKNAQYEQATDFFQNAVKLDPTNPNAKLYLATTYASQVVPNLTTPENLAIAQKALDGFSEVLSRDPKDLTALKQIASIDRNIGKLEQAKADELKVIQLAPNDPEAYYIIGSIDFNFEHYKNTVPILAADGLIDDAAGNKKMTKGACAKMKEANTVLVDEAMTNLQKAIDLNPNYSDAMDYLQLNYLEKANVDCADPEAQKNDLAIRDQWIQKAMGARKFIEQQKEKKAGGGVTM